MTFKQIIKEQLSQFKEVPRIAHTTLYGDFISFRNSSNHETRDSVAKRLKAVQRSITL